MKRNKIYTDPNGGFRIPHNKHLGNKHEEWIVPKKQQNRTIMESIIKWQTGEPKEEGDYLTTRKSEDGKTYVCYNFWVDKKWAAVPCDHSITIAWYRIDDIEPYKECSK